MITFSNKDIIKAFKEMNQRIDDLWCFIKECCSKIPINIGNGAGIYKDFKNNKWRFKSILPGSNIAITEQENTITINSTTEPVDCEDIKDCLGISPSGDPTKFLNEQGDWDTISLTGTPTEILYYDSLGNITSDSYFTRDTNQYTKTYVKDLTSDYEGGHQVGIGLLPTPLAFSGEYFYNKTDSDYYVFSGVYGASQSILSGAIDYLNLSNSSTATFLVYTPSPGITAILAGVNNTTTNTSAGMQLGIAGSEISYTNSGLISKFFLANGSVGWSYNSYSFNLPLTDGNSGDVLTTDGGGNLTFQPVSGTGYITAISDTNTIDLDVTANTLKADINYQNTSTINLSEDGSGLKADFASMNISQFTNDSGYITTSGQTIQSVTDTSEIDLTITANSLSADLKTTTVTPASYTNANITVDSKGRITAASNGSVSSGTVTNVSALTLGTTGTDLSSTVANSTTTPVITLNVPTASSTNRGALSSTDWSTFNNKQDSITSSLWGAFINALTGKTTPADADAISIMDSADSNNAKKLTWANIKSTLKTYFDTLYSQNTLSQIPTKGEYFDDLELVSTISSSALVHNTLYLAYAGGWQVAPAPLPFGRYGVNQVSTLSSTSASVGFGSTASYQTSFGAAYYECSVRFEDLSDGTNTFEFYAGLLTFASFNANNRIRFNYSHGINSGKWQIETQAGALNISTADSGVAVAADTWYKLGIQINSAGTSVDFFINGSNVGTLNTAANIPTSLINPYIQYRKTAGATARLMYCDYQYFQTTQSR